MASTVIKIDTYEESLPILAFILAEDPASIDGNPAGYTLTIDVDNSLRYSFIVPEACIGIYRIELHDGDGYAVQIGWVNIKADTAGPFIAGTSLTEEIMASLIEEIKIKTDLLGTKTIVSYAPVNGPIILSPLIIGDNYLTSLNNAFIFNFTPPPDSIIGSSTTFFGGKKINNSLTTWEVAGTLEDKGDGTWDAIFEITDIDTSLLTEGFYNWSVTFCDGANNKTIARGTRVKWIEKQTVSVC